MQIDYLFIYLKILAMNYFINKSILLSVFAIGLNITSVANHNFFKSYNFSQNQCTINASTLNGQPLVAYILYENFPQVVIYSGYNDINGVVQDYNGYALIQYMKIVGDSPYETITNYTTTGYGPLVLVATANPGEDFICGGAEAIE